jgi:membrane-bound serine protease (ClpP class)
MASTGDFESSMIAAIVVLTLFAIALIGLEVFLPGGILGAAGAACMIAAIVLCFTADELDRIGPLGRAAAAAGVVIVTGGALAIFLRTFQQTAIGRQLTLSKAVGGKEAFEAQQSLMGAAGTAKTDLRPAGKAMIGGKRVDVVAELGMIDAGTEVEVVRVEGMKVVVKAKPGA